MIQFHQNIAKLVLNQGILVNGLSANSAISIYSGTQPSAQDIIDNWLIFNATNPEFLAHYTNVKWDQPLNETANFISISQFPVSSTHPHSGTGQWCIVWCANPTYTQISDILIPTTDFIIGPISILSGNGIVRYNIDLDFTAGSSKIMADGVIAASGVAQN